ncbi:MAG: hypothetical protein GX348_06615 [Veillonellaceae bacterium]|jgi:hypothetical protein|nr:hypothetical protein [Veillonellaceae bacterium]
MVNNQSKGQNQHQTTNNQVSSNTNSMTAGVRPIASQSGNTQQATSQSTTAGGQDNRAVIGVFNSRSDAEKAVSELRNKGFNTEEINIVSKEGKQGNNQNKTYDDDITDGALTGGTLGGIGGLLLGAGVVASVGAMAIPGIGPVIASGPIAAAIGGAVAGGIAGGLIDWGIPAEASQRYEQSVAEGGILAVIRTASGKVDTAAQILRQNGATDIESHTAK